MNVIFISPGFPDEMPLFTRGLAAVGARVFGVGDQNQHAMAEETRRALHAYLQVRNLWAEEAVVDEVARWVRGQTIERVECLWEPGMVLAARLRERLGVQGLSVEQTVPFRDKETMKQVLDAADVRTPRHARCRTKEECRAAAERIGYPLIIKPIDGAGSADTYPLHEPGDLEQALLMLDHVPEVSVEEYVEGEELTFDTVCADGHILFENVALYRPKPLEMRLNPWISPQSICLRDLDAAPAAAGRALGHRVLRALGFRSGFTHMEWFLTPSGEAVFGEIGARAPGGRLVHSMNYSCDIDLFAGWAEAVCYGSLSQDTRKRFNSAIVFKRAQGGGTRITRIEGLDRIMAHYGEHIPHVNLVQIGEPRRDWRKIVSGDGWIVARHPDLDFTMAMSSDIAVHLAVHAD